jgi:hypothetical protein
MADTKQDDEVILTAVEELDTTEQELWSWGVSGQPVTWAWTHWQPVVSMIRAANTGFGDAAMVQTALDTVFPGMGYVAANVCLPHPPTAEFTIQAGDIDPELDPNVGDYLDIIHVDLVSDEDLGLPDEQVTWDFGDGTPVAHDVYGWDHGYTAAGVYKVRCSIPVAGVLYETSQDYTVGEPGPLSVDPAYAERPATVFDDPDNPPEELPYGNAPPTEEPETYDPGEYTVAEVKDYLAKHPDETDAVLEAEEAGKARSGILDL